jgi:hypothetical protein
MQRAGRHFFRRPSAARGGLAPQVTVRGRELLRRQVAEARMRPRAIVLIAPLLDLAPPIVERAEHLLIEALLAQATVKRFDESILDRLARLDELQAHSATIGPLVHHPPAKLRTVIRSNDSGHCAQLAEPLQYPSYPRAGK